MLVTNKDGNYIRFVCDFCGHGTTVSDTNMFAYAKDVVQERGWIGFRAKTQDKWLNRCPSCSVKANKRLYIKAKENAHLYTDKAKDFMAFRRK